MEDLRTMVDVVKNMSKIHQQTAANSARDYQLCRKYANLSQLITIGFPLLYISSAMVYESPAYFDMFTRGIIRPSVNIYLPGVNESDAIDMSVLLVVNVVAHYMVLLIICGTDPFIYIIFATIPMYSTIVQRQINDLKTELDDKQKASDIKLLKQQLIEIIEMQVNYNG